MLGLNIDFQMRESELFFLLDADEMHTCIYIYIYKKAKLECMLGLNADFQIRESELFSLVDADDTNAHM